MKGMPPSFSGSSRVLSFNYTSTVEELYGVDDICHIHGFAKDRGNLIFGHADDGPYQKEKDPMARRIGFVGKYPTEAKAIFRKDTGTGMQRLKRMLAGMDLPIREVRSFGCSYSQPDWFYLKEMANYCSSDSFWWLSRRSKDDKSIEEHMRVLRPVAIKTVSASTM